LNIKKNHLHKIIYRSFSGVCIIGIISVIVILVLSEPQLQKVDDLNYLSSEEIINPEKAVLVQYMTARNSKLSIEIASFQAEVILDVAEKLSVSPALINGIIEKESCQAPG